MFHKNRFNNLKILLFTESLRAGGKERRITELLKAFHGNPRFQFEVVLTKDSIHYEEFHSLGIPWHLIQRKWLKKDPRLFFQFFKIALHFKPDVIHVWGHMTAVYALPAKVFLGIPLINNEITDSALNKRLLAKSLVFRFSDRVISNSYAGLKAYSAPTGKSTVIYNGFSFERLRRMESSNLIRKQYGLQTTFLVGMVATFSINKDYVTFLKAAIDLVYRRQDVTFLCIGDGNDQDLRTMVPTTIGDRIVFMGKQQHAEALMQTCTIGVLTSNTNAHGEGISNALLEFMALERPVIATDYGGSKELIRDGQEGFLIAPFDAQGLALKIDFLLNHPEERLRMGVAGKKRVEDQFSIRQMTECFEKEYLKLYPRQTAVLHENINDRVTAL